MLALTDRTSRHCDGVTRRQALLAGALGLGGLTLADLLRAEAASGVRSSTKPLRRAVPAAVGPGRRPVTAKKNL
jgi:hypothetical protein